MHCPQAALEEGKKLPLELGRYLVPCDEKGFDNLADPVAEVRL